MSEPKRRSGKPIVVAFLGFWVLVACVGLGSGLYAMASITPMLVLLQVLLLVWLHTNRDLRASTSVALFWPGWAGINAVRVLEYGPNASVFDPMYGLFFLFVTATALVVTLGSFVAECWHRSYLRALVCVVAILVSWELMAYLNDFLTTELNIVYK